MPKVTGHDGVESLTTSLVPFCTSGSGIGAVLSDGRDLHTQLCVGEGAVELRTLK